MLTNDRKLQLSTALMAFYFLLNLSINAQTITQTQKNRMPKLSAGENALAQSSRAAIISTGISAPYFDEHFTLEGVVDKMGDRRVMWKYSVGEYETTLNDSIGFYTDEKGKRINSHAIRNLLGASRDIKNTIPRKRAEQLMRECIGTYTPGPVVFQAFGDTQKASLLLTASSVPLKQDPTDKLLIYTGFVNLETGACTKGEAQAGRPRRPTK